MVKDWITKTSFINEIQGETTDSLLLFTSAWKIRTNKQMCISLDMPNMAWDIVT